MIYTTKSGEKYTLQEGSRGGLFYIDKNGVKKYVKKSSVGKITRKPKKPAAKPFSFKKPELKKYICYYEKRNSEGELIDDWKEWTEAYSEEQAKQYFEEEYSHDSSVTISIITNE